MRKNCLGEGEDLKGRDSKERKKKRRRKENKRSTRFKKDAIEFCEYDKSADTFQTLLSLSLETSNIKIVRCEMVVCCEL